MKKVKQIMAIIGLVVIAALYMWALVAAIMARPEANAMFMAAIISTVVIPVMMYVVSWLGRVFSGRDLMEAVEEQAKKNVLSQLIISQIIKEEKLEATEEEIDAKVAEQAASVGKETEEYKKNMDPRQFNYIASDIVITKLFDFLKANNEMVKE